MKYIRGLLADHRVLLHGRGVSTMAKTGRGFPDDTIVTIQDDLILEPYTTYWGSSGRHLITMGAFSYVHTPMPMPISVGRYSSIAVGLRVMGAKHPLEWASTSPVFYNRRLMMAQFEKDQMRVGTYEKHDYHPGRITIGNDVWIGENVTLGHGVNIGDGSVVATNAVVVKDVPPYTIVGGVAAKTIRPRFDAGLVEELIDLRWWQYAPDDISDLGIRNPDTFVHGLRKRVEAGNISPYNPAVLTIDSFASLVK